MVFFLIFFIGLADARDLMDRVYSEGYLGEKSLDSYSERYQPLIFQDIYKGKMSFEDEVFFQNYFRPYLFGPEKDVSYFLKSELHSGLFCSNEMLSLHFDEIRYSYRLVTLSYLLEAQWQINQMSDHFDLENACSFELTKWAKSCRPKTTEMKDFISKIIKYNPKYKEALPPKYTQKDWWKEYSKKDFKGYPHYRFKSECQKGCSEKNIASTFKNICEENQKLMALICSEKDEIYGLSHQRDAYYLIGRSNIINTYNQSGEALGCLRRFSEVMSHKEVNYPALKKLFPSIQNHLRLTYQERFLQGRVFFLGSGKEFEEKGLSDLYVKDQALKIMPLPAPREKLPQPEPIKKEAQATVKTPEPAPVVQTLVKKKVVEIPVPQRSAFLQAADIRSSQDLKKVEVDMLKLKYDYVFTLNMMNTLSDKLKSFMTREALSEMMTYDKLGTKDGPVPLLFLKFMIDFEEHQGLWNIISILGDKFYVSNEIDTSFKTSPELVQLINNETTEGQWQLYILRP